ncbi:hypothetical protein DFJ58DRAFT_815122 [Suillus subalutaceus]|uniref:uncharacterized protein n=1 Tax=Suillus subalutaceus TaxID=48586 RepID=UPI001B871685|nr:uncharacterized protein DFJ58DRAFT_815122 [Suillus subalutaceus]KAG1837791.1 hypothetical protein DFJ58DRAFT_815122 [Suillus subalutaceus]
MHAAHQTSSITRGTHFGAQPYIPSSGASESFRKEGGHNSDTERDHCKAHSRSFVQCMHSVLTHILFQICPHLPALTHLLRIWTPLYSLDQHERAIFCRYQLSIITLSRILTCWPPLFNCSSITNTIN